MALRSDDQILDFDYSGNQGSLGNDSWMWSPDMSNDRPSLLFDFNESMSFKNNSEPVSPSSVETTPTTSEQPVVVSPQQYSEKDANSVLPASLSKRQRKSIQDRIDRNGRKKKYDAPPGVWRNSGGFISTVYINKKRVYGPLRREVADAVRDREEMLEAKLVIHTEEGMRVFVQGMKERCASLSSSQRQAVQNRSTAVVQHSTVRVSSRPVRNAAKRSILTAFSEDASEDDFETNPEETYHFGGVHPGAFI